MKGRDFEKLRNDMVDEVENVYSLKDKLVLNVAREVPRHKFADKAYWDIAYSDSPVPIGEGQTMSQPYTVFFMTHLLISRGNNSGKNLSKWKVLEIGTGSGYQAAILSKLV
jgi:protein-L-isoaspartate(D-aspartate) O-methyltransferase